MRISGYLYVFVALALMVPAIMCCGQRATHKSEAVGVITDESTLIFDKIEWDFGTIKESDGVVSHTFTFTNGGDNAIVIESVVVDCGCTTPEYSRQPVMSGKTSQIKISFDPMMRPGAFLKQIYVYSNGGKNRNTLTVKGDVEPRPRTIEEDYPFVTDAGVRFSLLSADLREVEQVQPKSMTIGYVNTLDREVSMRLNVTEHGDIFTATASHMICAGCRGEITITCVVPQGWIYGKIETQIVPIIDGMRAMISSKPVSFSVKGAIVDNFESFRDDPTTAPESEFSPLFHNFGMIKRGEIVSHNFSVTNSGRAKLIIRSIETQSGLSTTLKVADVVDSGKTVTFKVTLDSRNIDFGFQIITIPIVTNDPKHPIRNLRVAADIADKRN